MSKSIGANIANQKQGGRTPEPVRTGSIRPLASSDMEIPGMGGVVKPPQAKTDTAARFGDAVGGHFGGSR